MNQYHFKMGLKYHTVHDTHYLYNYGQVFTICDELFGTLYKPSQPTGSHHKQSMLVTKSSSSLNTKNKQNTTTSTSTCTNGFTKDSQKFTKVE